LRVGEGCDEEGVGVFVEMAERVPSVSPGSRRV
jgi:hypothetical protein